MFRQILYTQLKWTRVVVALLAVIAFVLPAAAWRLGDLTGLSSAHAVVSAFAVIGPMLAIVALLGGFVMAAQPWIVDAATRHVYPLALPVTWPRYVGMRFGAGALLLLIPVVALWAGSLIALAMVDLPATLHAYPGALALRFLLAMLLAYALTFALQYVAGRKSTLVLLFLLLGSIGIGMVLAFTGNQRAVEAIGRFLGEWPGPFAVYLVEWKLVDV